MAIQFERVILVHGTGATAPSEEGDRWWQRNGILWQSLCSKSSDQLQPEAFIWSGANSESARRDAGHKLCDRLIEIESEGVGVHLIGHSHGGSVIWHALRRFASKPDRYKKTVRSWSTVGTPFLAYGLRLPRLFLVIAALLASCFALGVTLPLFEDLELGYAWRDASIQLAYLVFLLTILSAVLMLSLKSLVSFAVAWFVESRVPWCLVSPDGIQRYLALWSRQDEPIVGLGASGSFSIQVIEETRRKWLSKVNLLSFRPPLAAAINQFVNNLVSRSVQGSTISHLDFRSTHHAPHASLVQAPLPKQLDDALIESANARSGALGRRIRDLLLSGKDPLTGFADLQSAAVNAMTFKELVHTTYFEERGCLDLLELHILSKSSLGQLSLGDYDIALRDYDMRFPIGVQASWHPQAILPSNRLEYSTALGTIALLAFISLLAAVGVAVHSASLASTTAKHHLKSYLSTQQLAAALASTVPAGDLSQVLKYVNVGFPIFTETTTDAEASSSSPNLEHLSSYVRTIVRADELHLLAAAVAGLESESMRKMFYERAFPIVLKTSTDSQLASIIDARFFLPGPNRSVNPFAHVDNYPALSEFLQSLAARSMVTSKAWSKLVQFCPSNIQCAEKLGLEAAYEIVRNGAESPPEFLLPLPRPTYLRRLVLPQAYTERFSLVRHMNVKDNWRSSRFLKWLVATRDWEQAAAFAPFSEEDPLLWEDFSPSIIDALQTAQGTTAIYVMQFMRDSTWSDAIPTEALLLLQSAVERQPVAKDRLDEQPVSGKELVNLIAKEVKRHKCAGLRERKSTRTEAENEEEAIAFCSGSNPETNIMRLSKDLDRASDADEFGGTDGLLKRLEKVVRKGKRQLDGELREEVISVLLQGMRNAVCVGFGNGSYGEFSEIDRKRLRDVFRMIGSPPPNGIAKELSTWPNVVEGNQLRCRQNDDLADKFSNDMFQDRVQAFTPLLADWVSDVDSGLAGALVQWAAGTSKDSPFTRKFGAETSNLVNWFIRNDYWLDALELSSTDTAAFQLQRRAAYLQLSGCYFASNDLSRGGA